MSDRDFHELVLKADPIKIIRGNGLGEVLNKCADIIGQADGVIMSRDAFGFVINNRKELFYSGENLRFKPSFSSKLPINTIIIYRVLGRGGSNPEPEVVVRGVFEDMEA